MWQIEGCWHANISDNGHSVIEGCWHANISDNGHSVTWQSAISEIGSAVHCAMMPL